MEAEQAMPPPIDLSKPKYDQNTYIGRAQHFFRATNPLNLLASNATLEEAKKAVETYKKTWKVPAGYDEAKLWRAKYLVDSAYHPDTGEKMLLVGRMSAQAPMNTIITGAMVTYYKSVPQVVFWQWLNQTFNAVVNYSNRSGDAPISKKQMLTSYLAAVGGALGTVFSLNALTKKMKNPIFKRFVPFAAVCGANFINIPMMRMNEIKNGTPVFTEKGERVGNSTVAAKTGIVLVALSRCAMATPGMVMTPLVMNYGVKAGWFCKHPKMMVPAQVGLVCLCVTIATPLCCAIFKQQAPIAAASLEKPIADLAKKKGLDTLYYNKGL